MADATLTQLDEAVQRARSAQPDIGVKRLTALLNADHPSWEVNTKAVKEALQRLDAEAAEAAPSAPAPASPAPASPASGTAESGAAR